LEVEYQEPEDHYHYWNQQNYSTTPHLAHAAAHPNYFLLPFVSPLAYDTLPIEQRLFMLFKLRCKLCERPRGLETHTVPHQTIQRLILAKPRKFFRILGHPCTTGHLIDMPWTWKPLHVSIQIVALRDPEESLDHGDIQIKPHHQLFLYLTLQVNTPFL
jgi:hypothetical protein